MLASLAGWLLLFSMEETVVSGCAPLLAGLIMLSLSSEQNSDWEPECAAKIRIHEHHL